jgi:hypothetical protein
MDLIGRLLNSLKISKASRELDGVLFLIDIKQSSDLAQRGSEQGETCLYINQCLVHIMSAITLNGGRILQTEGDAVWAFFEKKGENGVEVQEALNATRSIRLELEKWGKHNGKVHFRASFINANIRPILYLLGSHRQSAWTEVGGGDAFFRLAKLLSVEKEVADRNTSFVILTEAVAGAVEAMQDIDWSFRARTISSKQGSNLLFSGFIV